MAIAAGGILKSNNLSSGPEAPKANWLKFRRLAVGAVVLAFVFVVGVNVGNGHIHLKPVTVANKANQGLPATLDFTSANKVYRALKANFDGKLTESQLLAGVNKGLADATGDPYTEFFTASDAKDFNNSLNNSFSGIGAELGKDSEGNLIVVSPIKGFPADKAGLRAQDIITEINGTSTQGMTINDSVLKIRGKQGTKVTLKIVRDRSKVMTLTITRQDIHLPSVNTKILDGNIGYMQISTFGDDTADLATKAATDFKSKNVKGVILDLRGNPGGRLDAAVSLASLWLPEGKTILQEKTDGRVVDTYSATGNNVLSGIPTVVLIDGGSASASEITAGALKDNGVATLMGVKSFGKGSVQQIVSFADGSQLKVTIARWYRPNGQNIDHKGITPDKTIELSDADIADKNDIQLKAAEAFLNK